MLKELGNACLDVFAHERANHCLDIFFHAL